MAYNGRMSMARSSQQSSQGRSKQADDSDAFMTLVSPPTSLYVVFESLMAPHPPCSARSHLSARGTPPHSLLNPSSLVHFPLTLPLPARPRNSRLHLRHRHPLHGRRPAKTQPATDPKSLRMVRRAPPQHNARRRGARHARGRRVPRGPRRR